MASERWRVTFQSIDPQQAAEMEARHGEKVWPRLSPEDWDALRWYDVHNEGDEEAIRDQFRALSGWAATREQPIRHVRLWSCEPQRWVEETPEGEKVPDRG